jgi:hypothetical protein
MRRDVDAAREALRPVLALPTQLRVGWLGQSMKDFRRVITRPTLQESSGLQELTTDVEEFLETMLPQTLPGSLYS